jgi:hypothetical protein
MSPTSIDTLVPSLYQCIETRSIEVFLTVVSATSTLVGHHLRLTNVLESISRPSCEPLYAINTSQRKQETFLYEYPLHWVLLPTKKNRTTERCSSVAYSSSKVANLTTEPGFWTWHARLLSRLSWIWYVLPPSNTHRESVTSITAVLLVFVAYFVTPRRKLPTAVKEISS